MNQPQLLIALADQRKRIPLDGQPLTIGRHASNRLCIVDDRISRHHCVIELTNEGVNVVDLGSRNGTKVNGEKVKTVQLNPGDIVQVGPAVMRFELVDPSEATETPEVDASEAPVPAGDHTATADSDDTAAPSHPKRSGRRQTRGMRQASGDTETRGESVDHPPQELDIGASAADEDSTSAPLLRGGRLMIEPEADELSDYEEHYNHIIGELQRMVQSLPELPFTEAQIALRNSKGKALGQDDDVAATTGTRLMRMLLLLSMQSRATDIHVEPKPENVAVRLRVDGMMVDAANMHPSVGARLIGVVKVLSDIDIAQRHTIQEGHFASQTPDRMVDYRVSFTPAVYGQKLVIRVLDLTTAPLHIRDLQLPGWISDKIRQTIKRDSGMVLVCGPTGSGKTTTLYAIIRAIDVRQRNVITIEDPVEYQIDGVTQIPIDDHHGNTFSTLLRSVLRQDPDVILLGEIRDSETARIALQAAVTGHLVLSTVHARDGIGTIFRLMDLSAEPHLIASALNLVLAQRLVRRLCPDCKVSSPPRPHQSMKMGRMGEGVRHLWYPNGCPKCLHTGYRGRCGVYELLTATRELCDVLLTQPTMQELRKVISQSMFHSLREAGHKLVVDGVTSLDEVERVAGSED
jgi:general secretion pathway protein E